ncbi:hypothetical protein DMA11_22125 [Marinilabiliaceae bacterium JC017]|nr:hypothetical protein DMA11_22125 [Marinilabiliaceae bacterium JC017]
MTRNYYRNNLIGLLQLLLALVLLTGIIKEKSFIIIYDGIKIGLVLILLINGTWSLTTPIAKLRNKTLTLRKSLLSVYSIDLDNLKVIGYDKKKQMVKFDSIEFNLKKMKPDKQSEFIKDLKTVREAR